MSAEKSTPIVPGDSDRVDYYKLWGLDPQKDFLIVATIKFAVWLDEVGDLDHETKESHDRVLEEKVGVDEINGVCNRAAALQAYPIDYLSIVQRKNFRIMIGEGFARLYNYDAKSAMRMLDAASEYAVARNSEIARIWNLQGAGSTVCIFVVALIVGWFWRSHWIAIAGEFAFLVIFGSCFGALGAFLSILLRVGRVPLDPSAGRWPHRF